jgi:hypothetical protein
MPIVEDRLNFDFKTLKKDELFVNLTSVILQPTNQLQKKDAKYCHGSIFSLLMSLLDRINNSIEIVPTIIGMATSTRTARS